MSLGRFSKGKSSRQAASLKLGFETLEERLAMAVDLATITAPPIVVGKHTYVPLNGVDSNGLPVTYSVTSANASILGSIISTGRVLVLEVTGGTGASAFSGNLFIKLFEGKTPKTAARITELVNSGFYNNLTFHRISAGFVAQGGDPNGNGTGGSGTDFIDEFDPSLTFNSRGLFAMANAGDDDNDSQFFITDTNNSSSFPEHLNFNHTIFGIMVDPTFSGSDTFTRMMTTPVNQGTETPTSPITIKRAYLINDNQHAVLDLSTTLTAATTTAQQITIRATNSRGEVDTQTVNVTVRLDQSNGGNTNDRAFLNQIFDRQTTVNTPITFDVTGTDLDGNPLTFVVRNSDFSELTDSDDVTVTVTQLTNNSARITITPDTDFTGLVNLKIGVTDDTTNPQLTDFDTQAFNLFVTNDPISPRLLKLVSGTGVLPGDFVNFDTPTIEFIAPADKTVKVFVNGNEVGTATQLSTNNGDGTYRFTLPRNVLFLGSNAITAVTQENGSSSLASTPLSVTFAPSIQQIYVVPGAPGEQITLTFNFLANKAIFRNEVGLYVVDDLTGKVNGISPNSANYRSNVLNSSSRQTLFSLQAGGSTSTKTLTFAAGTKLAFYLVQNKSAASAVAATNIFFSLKDANADKLFHAEAFTDKTGRSVFGWEDARGGGDRDYNDLVFSIRRDAAKPAVGALAVDIAGSGTTVKTSFGLLPTLTSRFRPIAGEIGIFPVLDALGSVRSTTNPAQLLTPGSTNYVDTAIRQLGQQTLFAPGDKPGYTNRTINMAGGSLFGIYYIPRGTLEDVIAGNTSVKIFFSFAAANADGGKEHMRTYGRESENRFGATLTPLLNDPQRVHLMGVFNGGDRNFTDFILTYQQSL